MEHIVVPLGQLLVKFKHLLSNGGGGVGREGGKEGGREGGREGERAGGRSEGGREGGREQGVRDKGGRGS